MQVSLLRQGGLQVVEESEAGEHLAVDGVALGSLAMASEKRGAEWIDHGCFAIGRCEALLELAVIASARFEDGAGDTVLKQPIAPGVTAALAVVEAAFELALEDVGIEPSSADLATSMPAATMGLGVANPPRSRYGLRKPEVI